MWIKSSIISSVRQIKNWEVNIIYKVNYIYFTQFPLYLNWKNSLLNFFEKINLLFLLLSLNLPSKGRGKKKEKKEKIIISKKQDCKGIASFSAISHAFHSLFKVLFIFPSRYLYAIGLTTIFSHGWHIPPKKIKALLPKNLTHTKWHTRLLTPKPQNAQGCHLVARLIQEHFILVGTHSRVVTWHKTTIQRLAHTRRDFKTGLFPLHSPLLWKSRLFSFPPLNNMLKFSRYSYFIWENKIRIK